MTNFKLSDFITYKRQNKKITMLTAYDFTSAYLTENAGIDTILVGDSLGMVIQGNDNTLSVSVDEIIYHSKLVKKGAPKTFIIADMPYLSYHISIEQSILNAGKIMKQTGCHAVKLEINSVNTIKHAKAIIDAQIPIVGHVGLTPQSVNILGGFKRQGKTASESLQIMQFAKQLQESGAIAIVLECIPSDLAKQITQELSIPTIGIGSGVDCDGQVLVFHDLIGINSGYIPKFAKSYINAKQQITEAIASYVNEVKSKTFPDEAHTLK